MKNIIPNICFLLFYLGISLVSYSGYLIYSEYFFYGKWDTVQGKITHLDKYINADDPQNIKPVYNHNINYNYKNRERTIITTKSIGVPKFEIDDTFTVKINPINTKEIKIYYTSPWKFIYMILLSGLLSSILGNFNLFRRLVYDILRSIIIQIRGRKSCPSSDS